MPASEGFAMKKRIFKRKLKSASAFDVILTIFFCLMGMLMLYPLYHVVIVSLSNTVSYATHTPYVLPYTFDLTGYNF